MASYPQDSTQMGTEFAASEEELASLVRKCKDVEVICDDTK